VDVIDLVPLDVKVTGQALRRARDASIIVITQEDPNQAGKNLGPGTHRRAGLEHCPIDRLRLMGENAR